MIKPPGINDADYKLVPPHMREDANQEAWLAHLEGQSPRKAIHRYVTQEKRHEAREPNFTDAGLND